VAPAIKAHAVALLAASTGFNGYAAADVLSGDSNSVRNNIGVALCAARDEMESIAPRRAGRLNKGAFDKAAREIACELRQARGAAIAR
jgi:hypothetical protein